MEQFRSLSLSLSLSNLVVSEVDSYLVADVTDPPLDAISVVVIVARPVGVDVDERGRGGCSPCGCGCSPRRRPSRRRSESWPGSGRLGPAGGLNNADLTVYGVELDLEKLFALIVTPAVHTHTAR